MKVLGTLNVEGKQYALISISGGTYVNGIFAKYLLTPVSSIERELDSLKRLDDDNENISK